MDYWRFKAIAVHIVVCLVAIGASGEVIRDWELLPEADQDTRRLLNESVVTLLPGHWSVDDGGLPPGQGDIPSFRHSAYALLGLYEANPALLDQLGIDREAWTLDVVAKMAASQVRDQEEADPANYPSSLYGSIVYPGWRDPSLWPAPVSRYEWDPFVPPPLISLLNRHRNSLPPEVNGEIETMLWYAADGALRTWYAVRDLEEISDPEEYWGHTNYSLMYIQTLILAGEMTGHEGARHAGIDALRVFLDNLRRRGVHEYASPTYIAVDLDCAAHLAAESSDPAVRSSAVQLWLYLWTDMMLSMSGDTMGGPASRNLAPLIPNGGHQSHLLLAGMVDQQLAPDPINAYRATIDRRPPVALTRLGGAQIAREVYACWGDAPGQDRSLWVEPGLTVGISAAYYGRQDRGLAVDFGSQAARVHLSADRGAGSGGLPSSNGSGHNLMLYSGARSGRSVLMVAESYPYNAEERVVSILFLPAAGESFLIGDRWVDMPEIGIETVWSLAEDEWVAIEVGDWWLVARSRQLNEHDLHVRAPAELRDGVRVLQFEIRGTFQGQSINAAWAVMVLARDDVANREELQNRLDDLQFDFTMTAIGPRARLTGQWLEEPIMVTHDALRHRLAERSPEPPTICGIDAPLQAHGLRWQGGLLSVLGGVDIDLRTGSAPRRVRQRAP